MADDWITTAQAAKISGYHPERIRELARDGKISARKWGAAYQISRGSLLSYIKNVTDSGDKRFGPKHKKPKS